MIERGNYIRIKDNLCEELEKLGFEAYYIENMRELIGTKQKAFTIWEDTDKQKYVSIDLCIEIPIQCLEKL